MANIKVEIPAGKYCYLCVIDDYCLLFNTEFGTCNYYNKTLQFDEDDEGFLKCKDCINQNKM